MLLILSDYLAQYWHAMRVVQYLTVRGIFSALTALFITLLFGPAFIRGLVRHHLGQTVRKEGPTTHYSKNGTPTMGGALVILAIVLTTLLWGDLSNHYLWLILANMLIFAGIGYYDDYRKIQLKGGKGLLAWQKFALQSLSAIATVIYLYLSAKTGKETALLIPLVKNTSLALGPWFMVLSYIVIVGSSNALNLTDGLDGLAIMPVVMLAGALGIFAYVAGHVHFANYLGVPHIAGSGELVVICGSIVGAGLGFLWFNAYPAQVFMGDVGSLALGAALGIMAIIVRQELVFFIMSGILVLETLSVIIQVLSFKLRGRRVFKMAPIHHHFELLGWPEPRVIVRFWIITFVLVLCGLATLKLR